MPTVWRAHQNDSCDATALKCPNCAGPHEATSKDCQKIKDEMSVLRKMVRDNSTHRQAATSIRRRRRRSRHRRQHDKSTSHTDGPSTAWQTPRLPSLLLRSRCGPDVPSSAAARGTHALHKTTLPPTDSDIDWPSLPPKQTGLNASGDVSSKVVENDKTENENVRSMLKHLITTMRSLLCGLQTPVAKTALHVLDALEPLLAALQ